jgi:hypothetical protein
MKTIIKLSIVACVILGLSACTPKPDPEDTFEPLTSFVVSAILGSDVTQSISLALDETEVSAILESATWTRDDTILSQSSTIVVTVTDKLGDRYAFSSGQHNDTVIVTRKSDGKQFGYTINSGTVEDLRVLIQTIGNDPVLVKPQYSYMISFDGIYDPTKFVELDQSYNSVINLFPESILIDTDLVIDANEPIDYVLRVNLGKYITVYREEILNVEFPFEPGWRYVSIGSGALHGPENQLYLVSEWDLGINSNLFYYPSVEGPETLNLSELNLSNYTIEKIRFGILMTSQPSFGVVSDAILDVLTDRIGESLTQTTNPHVSDFAKMMTFETDLGFLYVNEWGFILDEDPLTPGVAYYERSQLVDLSNLLFEMEFQTRIPIDRDLPDLTPKTLYPYTPDPITLTGQEQADLLEALDVSKWTQSNLIPWEPFTYEPDYELFTADDSYLYFNYPTYQDCPFVIIQVDGDTYYVTLEHFLAIKAVMDEIEGNH